MVKNYKLANYGANVVRTPKSGTKKVKFTNFEFNDGELSEKAKADLDEIKPEMEETKNRKSYIINDQGRECTKCGEFKLWSFFWKHKECRNGRQASCRECNLLSKKKRCSDPERVLLFNNIERKFEGGDVREDGMVFKEYNITLNPKNNFERWITKEAHENNQECNSAFVERRKAAFQKVERKYKRGHIRDDGMIFWEYSQTHASNNFEKWATQDEFDLLRFNKGKRDYMRGSLGKFGGKDESSDKIIGLNKHDLSCYIESLFEEGMTWKNRGTWQGKWNPKKPKWHLDHIIPLDAANTLEEARHLWHYTNLRPMWGNKNISKSNKYCPKELKAFLEERKAAK